MADLAYLTTAALAELIRDRHVSAVEALEAQLARVARVNPALNAIVTLDAAGARERARAADAALARGEVWGPLHGVALTLKDCHATAGLRTTAGHPPLAEYVPEQDGAVSARLKAAGAIVLGKTNVPPLLAHPQTDNEIFGRTSNPWDIARTPGGSSGGAAAALAAGLTPLEVGSDIGGSIRMPAHCCGVYGLKPTAHRLPVTGHIPDRPGDPRTLRGMNVVGPMARDLDDLALAFRLLAGPDGRDADVPPLPVADIPRLELRELRIAFAPALPGLAAAADIRVAVERLAGELAAAGARVAEALPDLDFAAQARARATLKEYAGVYVDPATAALPAAEYFAALDARDGFIAAWERFFDDWDAVLLPVMGMTAFPHGPVGTPVAVDGAERPYAEIPDYCRPFNLTGHPAVAFPVGLDGAGLPIGLQLGGRRWSDERLLGIARAMAPRTPGFQRPPGY